MNTHANASVFVSYTEVRLIFSLLTIYKTFPHILQARIISMKSNRSEDVHLFTLNPVSAFYTARLNGDSTNVLRSGMFSFLRSAQQFIYSIRHAMAQWHKWPVAWPRICQRGEVFKNMFKNFHAYIHRVLLWKSTFPLGFELWDIHNIIKKKK